MVNIIGAGLAGLSAACELAKRGIRCRLISPQRSERAQSVLAEGGINAALDTMNEHDSPAEHYEDTMRGGCYLADPNAVAALTENAPAVVERLFRLGVPFGLNEKGIQLRNFGGQKKKRTAYAKSSTGKILMTALIDEVRKYEHRGLVKRYPHHELIRLMLAEGRCEGAFVRDCYSGLCAELGGEVILACGGMNGMFPRMTTGTTQNTADAAAELFGQGIRFCDLEMLQYHPTTIGISGKRCLITEAARGEGGRLWISRGGSRWYFMEEKYPELGNLMPRDVVAREMFFVRGREDTDGEVMLDMTELTQEVWKKRLSDLRDEIIRYTGSDPESEPIAVHEGIHYFMGGIDADERHRTSVDGLYAAGECCCLYHGANRLGGNSMLGAVYGGITAAETAASRSKDTDGSEPQFSAADDPLLTDARTEFTEALGEILTGGLGIVRSGEALESAIERAERLNVCCPREENKRQLGLAMLRSAYERRESRGAHYRSDYPESSEEYRRQTVAIHSGGRTEISFRSLPERRASDADKT